MVKYGPKIWNFLPFHVKTSENLKTFKNIIKNWNSSTCNCKVCQSGAELILSLKFFLPVQHLLILCTSHIKKVRHIRSKGKKVRKARDYVKSLGTSGTQGTKAHETRNLAPSYILCVYVCIYHISSSEHPRRLFNFEFSKGSSYSREALFRGKRSLNISKAIKILFNQTCLFNQTIRTVIITEKKVPYVQNSV